MSEWSDTGRQADRPSDIPGRGWWHVLKRTWAEATADNLDIIAAGVAFYLFLALVPLLAALVLTYGLIVEPAEAAQHIEALVRHVPAEAAQLISAQLRTVVTGAESKQGLGLLLALLLALYGAMKGSGAIVTALNIAYEEQEARGFVRRTLVTLAITVGAVLFFVAIIAAGSVSGFLESLVYNLGPTATGAIKLLSWLGVALLASLGIALLYRYAPSRDEAKWRWLTPGSFAALAGLVIATAGFGFYASNFGDYGATYGALSSVVVLLLWLYIAAYVLLLGAELNAELEHQTERDTTTGPEQPLGSRKAVVADTVAPAPVDH